MNSTTEIDKLLFILIDDDILSNVLLTKLIEKVFNNVDVVVINNFTDSISVIEKQEKKIDLIFLDINLGNDNGWQLLDKINELYSKKDKELPKVIMLSNSVFEGDKLRAKKYSNIIQFISKPMLVNELKLILNTYFSAP